ncbi:hypothetical protein JG616_12035 [Luteimonas sp. MC1782]|nr:hypothetical protein [Luteimonas sp. MC1895]
MVQLASSGKHTVANARALCPTASGIFTTALPTEKPGFYEVPDAHL